MSEIPRQLNEARSAASELQYLKDQASALPELERDHAHAQRVSQASAVLFSARADAHEAVEVCSEKIAEYHERLRAVAAELEALAEILGKTGSTVHNARVRLAAACMNSATAEREYEHLTYSQASDLAMQAENLMGEIWPDTSHLQPLAQDNGRLDQIAKVIIEIVNGHSGRVHLPDQGWAMPGVR